MSVFKPEFETYQDVKTTIGYWSIPTWSLFCFGFFFVVSEEHWSSLFELLPKTDDWVTSLGSVAGVLALGGVLSHFFTHIVELHDRIYDKYFVKWRALYTVNFMLPALLAPYECRYDQKLLSILKDDQIMALRALFYPFAGDRDTKIRRNLVVRFYERIAKYWWSQVFEAASVIFVVITLLYFLIGRFLLLICDGVGWVGDFAAFWAAFVAFGLFVLFQFISTQLRKSVQLATSDEIADIHRSCGEEFEEALKGVCDEYGVDFQ